MQMASCMCGTHVLRIIHFILITVQTVHTSRHYPLLCQFISFTNRKFIRVFAHIISTTHICDKRQVRKGESNREKTECSIHVITSTWCACEQSKIIEVEFIMRFVLQTMLNALITHLQLRFDLSWFCRCFYYAISMHPPLVLCFKMNSLIANVLAIVFQQFAFAFSMVHFNVNKRNTNQKLQNNSDFSISLDFARTIDI